MAAVNLGCTWRFNLYGAPAPFEFPVKFDAGVTQAVKMGEILDLSGAFAAPLASDKAMSSIIAVSKCEIRNGDFAGYRMAVIPRPGDVFEYALSAAAAPAVAAALYWSDSETVKTAGTNILAYVHDESMIPLQGFQSVNPSFDMGTTLRTVSKVRIVFKASVSYWAALQP